MYKITNHQIEDIPYTQAHSHGGIIVPKFIIVHFTAGRSFEKSLRTLTGNKVSAHLLIGRDGQVTQMVPFNIRAYHAGRSRWTDKNGTNYNGMNGYSIGIEHDNAGKLTQIEHNKWETWFNEIITDPASVYTHTDGTHWHSYTYKQLETSIEVLKSLCNEYDIPTENILHHSFVSPRRKSDAGPAYPLDKIKKIINEL